MKAIWHGQVVAEADDAEIIRIEGNAYFPPQTLRQQFFTSTAMHTTCPWKGEASYYTVQVDNESNHDAAWYYPTPKATAIKTVGRDFSNYVAFWRGVEVRG